MEKLPRVENDEDGFGIHYLNGPNSVEHPNLIEALRERQREYNEAMLKLQSAIGKAKDINRRIADLRRYNNINENLDR